jgi:hypothetical protein
LVLPLTYLLPTRGLADFKSGLSGANSTMGSHVREFAQVNSMGRRVSQRVADSEIAAN